MILQTDHIYLALLSEQNASPEYAAWMNDYEITRFLESRWRHQDGQSIAEFIRGANGSDRDFLFGIFLREDGRHIGNIKIGNVSWMHRHADVGLLIGDRASWGKGCGAAAIRLATEYAFKSLNLHKLFAGIYEGNEGSYRAFLKAGWQDAGRLKEHYYYEGAYVDKYLVEAINK